VPCSKERSLEQNDQAETRLNFHKRGIKSGRASAAKTTDDLPVDQPLVIPEELANTLSAEDIQTAATLWHKKVIRAVFHGYRLRTALEFCFVHVFLVLSCYVTTCCFVHIFLLLSCYVSTCCVVHIFLLLLRINVLFCVHECSAEALHVLYILHNHAVNISFCVIV